MGIPLDSAVGLRAYEAVVVIGLVFSLIRVAASVVAPDQIIFLAQAASDPTSRIIDLGP